MHSYLTMTNLPGTVLTFCLACTTVLVARTPEELRVLRCGPPQVNPKGLTAMPQSPELTDLVERINRRLAVLQALPDSQAKQTHRLSFPIGAHMPDLNDPDNVISPEILQELSKKRPSDTGFDLYYAGRVRESVQRKLSIFEAETVQHYDFFYRTQRREGYRAV